MHSFIGYLISILTFQFMDIHTVHTGAHASKFCKSSRKEKHMLKRAVSFFAFIYTARVHIIWWFISCIVDMPFITLFSLSKGLFIEDDIQEI